MRCCADLGAFRLRFIAAMRLRLSRTYAAAAHLTQMGPPGGSAGAQGGVENAGCGCARGTTARLALMTRSP